MVISLVSYLLCCTASSVVGSLPASLKLTIHDHTLLDIIAGTGDVASMPNPGGKAGAGVYQTIINRMPPHRVYIEPFLGGAAIMRHKRPAAINIGIDKDPKAVKAVKAVARSGIAENSEGRFQIEAGDGLAFLRSYRFAGDELVYCDPPYLFETRSSDRTRYAFELGHAGEHRALLDILTALPCMVMISSYWSRLYTERLRDWHSVRFQVMTHGGPRTEWLWSNFPEPVALHDYRHLGASFRERERIKRKKQRWTSRLHRLPMLERQALLAAIDEAWRIHSPKTTMSPASPSFSAMPGHASPELARANIPSPETNEAADIAGCDEAIFQNPPLSDEDSALQHRHPRCLACPDQLVIERSERQAAPLRQFQICGVVGG